MSPLGMRAVFLGDPDAVVQYMRTIQDALKFTAVTSLVAACEAQ
jgi:hypothetical protein